MISIKRILCPIDLSPDSDAALRYAVALATAYEAKLFVCHCLESSPLADGGGQEQIRRLFEEIISAHIPPDKHETFACEAIVMEADPVISISQTAAERHIDLIVMRSRRRPLAAALLGSTAEAVCRNAPCPVLVTHPQEREWIGSASNEIGLKRVLVAYDFSNNAELALSYGLSLAQEYQAELHLLHVMPSSYAPALAYSPSGSESLFYQAARRLDQAVPSEALLWCEVKQVISEGQPYREILTYAEEQEIDLICMGTHGAGFGMRALFGSNVDRVLRQAPCPVLIARPLKPAEAVPIDARQLAEDAELREGLASS
jgi:nucleotide-binding universal stress UspA family protein